MSRLRAMLFPGPNHGNADNSIGSAAALTVVGVFVQGLSRFGYSILVARLLGKEVLGEVNLTLSLAVFMVLLWPQASGTAAAKFIAMARGREDRAGHLGAASFAAASSFAGAALLGSAAVAYAALVLDLTWAHALSAGLLVVCLGAYNFTRGVRAGNNHFATMAVWDMLSSFVTLTLLTLVLFAGWHWALLLPLAIGYSVFAAPAWPRRSRTRPDAGTRREILGFTAWGSAYLLAVSGLLHLSVVLGHTYASAEALGLYTAAVALATPASMLSGAMMAALSPSVAQMFAGGRTAELTGQVDLILRTMVTLFLPIFGVGALWAEPVLVLVYGAEFRGAAPLLVILFFAVSATSFNAANARLNGTESWGIKVLAAANGVGLVAGLTTIVVLGPGHGILASAVGYLVGSLLSALLPLIFVWRLDRLRWGGVLLRILAGYAMVLGGLALLGDEFRFLPALGVTVAFLAAWAALSARDAGPMLRSVAARLGRQRG